MYAIIQSGGQQVRVTPGATVNVDRVRGKAGDEVSVSKCCSSRTTAATSLTGTPFVAGAKVVAVVEGESRGPKIRVFKKKRRKGMRRTRPPQHLTTCASPGSGLVGTRIRAR